MHNNYYKIIGISKDDEIIMLDYIFNDGKNFKGATGTQFAPVSQAYIDDMNDADYLKEEYDYLWREAVASNATESSLDEYIDEMLRDQECNGDGEFIGHDTSYINYISDEFKEKYFPDAVTFECIGGGRIFNEGFEDHFKVILEPELIDKIKDIEGYK